MNPLDDRYRRLQVGAAGLMAVLLLVGLAGLLGKPDPVGQEAHAARDSKDMATGSTVAARTSSKSAPSEPLVELGVQPAPAGDKARQSSDALPAAVAPGQKVPDLEPDPRLEPTR